MTKARWLLIAAPVAAIGFVIVLGSVFRARPVGNFDFQGVRFEFVESFGGDEICVELHSTGPGTRRGAVPMGFRESNPDYEFIHSASLGKLWIRAAHPPPPLAAVCNLKTGELHGSLGNVSFNLMLPDPPADAVLVGKVQLSVMY